MNVVTTWVLVGASIGIVLLPPKWDPAIRIKEWLEDKKDNDRG